MWHFTKKSKNDENCMELITDLVNHDKIYKKIIENKTKCGPKLHVALKTSWLLSIKANVPNNNNESSTNSNNAFLSSINNDSTIDVSIERHVTSTIRTNLSSSNACND